MKFSADDIHSLTVIALDPDGEFADLLMGTLEGEARTVAQGLRGEKPLEELTPSLRTAVEEFQSWAQPEEAAA